MRLLSGDGLRTPAGHFFGAIDTGIAAARNLSVRLRAVLVEAAWSPWTDSTQGHIEGKINLNSKKRFLCCSVGNSVTQQLGNELCLAAYRSYALRSLLRSPSTLRLKN
jgi:hypothetical protein